MILRAWIGVVVLGFSLLYTWAANQAAYNRGIAQGFETGISFCTPSERAAR